MDVAISALRAELSSWLEKVRDGEEIVITDRGIPVARLMPVEGASLLEDLHARGVVSKPKNATRPHARSATRAHASDSVSELVGEQRR
jgi:prevent-host-death family protein